MCRITAVLSSGPANCADLLIGGPKSLLAQADAVPGRFQDDGWGIGSFHRSRPAVTKSPGPARLEKKAFVAAACRVISRVTVAHLRDASNPSGLPKTELVGPANTQPFSGDGLMVAHNGTLFIHREIRARLGKYADRIRGINDSEVLFWQTVKMLKKTGDPVAALEAVLDEVLSVWLSCRDSYPDRAAPYRGLNIFLAAKDSLTVLCHYQLKKEGGKGALLTPGWEFGRIAWRQEKSRVIFSSEPADTEPGWRKMNDPAIASARLIRGGIELNFKKLHLEKQGT